jgi:REP element-mobilizing transposase RayT
MPFDLQHARPLLHACNLTKLFIEELGWEPCRKTLTLRVAENDFALTALAEKRGFIVWLCESPDGSLPDHSARLKLDRKLSETSFEHLIVFVTHDRSRQSWVWVRREPGKPLAARTHEYRVGQPGDSLLQKLQALYVSLEEEEAGEVSTVTVAGRARAAFDIERVTKSFYRDFDTHRKAFLKFIDGIGVVADREWYASVMLNRLMFVYFIQRKGFLDGDRDYLRNRLDRCQKEQGKDQFYTFYRYFLLRLFHEGFGKRRADRAPDLEKLLGSIPYLNGGLFDVHELEKPERYGKDIQIPDQAFERIFDYFDQYQWHLDERPLRQDNEINPDVLGYIFEKFINQKQMGAYYTKEDITEYISKNTVIPFLVDAARSKCKVAFEEGDTGVSPVWDLLKENPDRYIYPAVRHGVHLPLPPEIAIGLDTDGSAGVPPAPVSGQDARAPGAAALAMSQEGSAGVPPATVSGQDARVPGAAATAMSQEGSAGVSPASHACCGQDARAPFFNPFAEIDISTHKLPHWNQADCYCFVTWRLDDAMPQEKLAEWEEEREAWLKAHPEPWDAATALAYHRCFSNRLDEWLDAGHGSCVLKQSEIRKIVADALAHFDGQRYELAGYVIMPNHIHVLLRLKAGHALADILHSWKSFTAKTINKALNRTGTLWQPEYWDRLIRNERHLAACLGYIRDNPVKACLADGMYTLWSAGVPPASQACCGQDARAPVAAATTMSQGRSSHAVSQEGSAGVLARFPNECGRDARAPLLERRKAWNKPAPAEFALPTEIWREVVARRQRYEEVSKKLANGEVREINDFITLNLDIRQFAQDVIQTCEGPDLLMALWQPITTITILDPTGGSGAFIFAALNILDPLYEACLDRMEAFLAEWDRSAGVPPASLTTGGQDARAPLRHPNYHKRFSEVLARVDAHPNRRYFVLKSIILNNLYAVDIMEEAVEICKLRLFLKLAAQVEPDPASDNLGIEPLPDIDFNIRAGNTLVGYATADEVRRCMTSEKAKGADQMRLGLFGEKDAYAAFEDKLLIVDAAARTFREQQTNLTGTVTPADKRELQKRLAEMEQELNRHLAGEYGIKGSAGVPPASISGQDARAPVTAYAKWLKSHQPFHWFIQFYGILSKGGFDVIIGNPPYVELKALNDYNIRGYSCTDSGNLYALVMERCAVLGCKEVRQGYIVPVSSVSTDRYDTLQKLLVKREVFYSSYDDRPSRLFDELEHIRLTIHIMGGPVIKPQLYSTRYNKWMSDERLALFSKLTFTSASPALVAGTLPKLCSGVEREIVRKLTAQQRKLSAFYTSVTENAIYYSRKVGYFLQVLDFEPRVIDGDGNRRPPSEFKELRFSNDDHAKLALCCLNSSLFNWFTTVFSDCRHVNKREVDAFPIDLNALSESTRNKPLIKLGCTLMADLKCHSTNRTMRFKHDTLTVQCIYPKNSKSIIDEIDTLLAKHYGFTDEELDFIINYDIKYRLGRDAESEDE